MSRLPIDARALEAEKAKGDCARRDDTPLGRIHRIEVANELRPSVKKPGAEREVGKDYVEHVHPRSRRGVRVSLGSHPNWKGRAAVSLRCEGYRWFRGPKSGVEGHLP